MQGSTPQTFSIADFLKWNDDGELVLNPTFQRGPVWSSQARTYLIDSIIRGYPIPKLLLRTSVDRDSRRTTRDVVDGQQRLRTIIDFNVGKFILGDKAKEFKGFKYSSLSDELKDKFLNYKLTCEQLINASNEDVLEVFVRINSNAVPVSEAELRNARFDNDFSNLVKETVSELKSIWKIGIISERERIRMVDQAIIAEAFAFLERGVITGGEASITKFYESVKSREKSNLPSAEKLIPLISETVQLVNEIQNEPLVKRPHFLMLLAAVMYKHNILPQGKLDFSKVDPPEAMFQDVHKAAESIIALNSAVSTDAQNSNFQTFRDAMSTTQGIKSRQVRFEYFCGALCGHYSN